MKYEIVKFPAHEYLGQWKEYHDKGGHMPVSPPPHVLDELVAGKMSAAKNAGKSITWDEAREQVDAMLNAKNRMHAFERWREQGLIKRVMADAGALDSEPNPHTTRQVAGWMIVKTGETLFPPSGETISEPSEEFFANMALAVGAAG